MTSVSLENLNDDEFVAMKSLLDSVERNQRSGLYLRRQRDTSFQDVINLPPPSPLYHLHHHHHHHHPHQQSTFAHLSAEWDDNWNKLMTQERTRINPDRRTPFEPSGNSIVRTRSLSPTTSMTVRVSSRVGSGLPLGYYRTTGHHHYDYETTVPDPICRSRQKVLYLNEARQSAGKSIQRKLVESHRDLETLKRLIRNTFGGEDDVALVASDNSNERRFKFNPEVLLDTIEKRRRLSLPNVYESVSSNYLQTLAQPRVVNHPAVFKISQNGPHWRASQKKPFDDVYIDYLPPKPVQSVSRHTLRLVDNGGRHDLSYRGPSYASLYHLESSDDSRLSPLDLASTRSYKLRPEESYFSVDKRRQNQLVRSRLPGLYRWKGNRCHSASPHSKLAVFSGQSFHPRYHYKITRRTIDPLRNISYLADQERSKLEKHEILFSLAPRPLYYRPHFNTDRRSQYEFESSHIDTGDELGLHPFKSSHLRPETIRTSGHFRRSTSRHIRQPLSIRHPRTRSLPPSYRMPRHQTDLISPYKTESKHQLETLDRIMDEFDGPSDLHGYDHNHPFVTHHYGLRTPNSYEFYRQLYKKHLSNNPEEGNFNYANDHLHLDPSIYLSKTGSEHHVAPSNTIYQDGQFFDHQFGGRILTPPTRVTKPEAYLRRSTSGEYVHIVSKHDFQPSLNLQRYSVY